MAAFAVAGVLDTAPGAGLDIEAVLAPVSRLVRLPEAAVHFRRQEPERHRR